MRNATRAGLVVLLIVAFALTAFTRQFASHARLTTLAGAGGGNAALATSNLSRMNSFALALLLGGLRGPLVMMLWTSSESQKTDRNLEDFDTKVEWIRMLQPEFDSVHIFQVWNKAYNISVQMASLPNKYRVILEALDYANSVDRERPHNINILSAYANVYMDKLGNSTEKDFYRAQVREESRARRPAIVIMLPSSRESELASYLRSAGATADQVLFRPAPREPGKSVLVVKQELAAKVRSSFTGADVTYTERAYTPVPRNAPNWRRTELEPMLDDKGMLLPELLQPRPGMLLKTDRYPGDFYNGAELQFLEEFQPFPYGVSPLALGYNYHKRSQQLLRAGNQRHQQLSNLVIDSRPAIALKLWAEEEWERARRAEIGYFDQRAPKERIDMEMPTASIPVSAINPSRRMYLDEAIYSYDRMGQLAEAARKEYVTHIRGYRTNEMTYVGHIALLEASATLCRADSQFLKGLLAAGEERTRLFREAQQSYAEARAAFDAIILRAYTTDEVLAAVLPSKKPDRAEIGRMNPEQLARTADAVFRLMQQDPNNNALHTEDALEFFTYIARTQARYVLIESTLTDAARVN